MFAYLKRSLMVALVAGTTWSASGYSLLMPYDTWQTAELNYVVGATFIGGPANQFVGEEYRVTRRTLYYGFDISFLDFFGAQGTNAVISAMNILNAIPAASTLSSNLSEYPLDTTRQNYQAGALNLFDLKSFTLSAMLEQMGLGDPVNYTWCLRSRVQIFAGPPPIYNYAVIKRNYDPVTREISSYVNGVLYTYVIFETGTSADAVEIQVDPLMRGRPVAGAISSYLSAGNYFNGLTRDDIGGWRRLYENSTATIQNHVESLPLGTEGQFSSDPWSIPPGGTNATSNTVAIVTNAIRSGVDKITFTTGNYDSFLGAFVTPLTNKWNDTYRSNMNSSIQTQKVQRVLLAPDFIFEAEDMDVNAGGLPILFTRSDTSGWVNNDAINGTTVAGGPGTIEGPAFLTFSSVGPYLMNQTYSLMDEYNILLQGFTWGSFDGTTNAPTIYPTWASSEQVRLQAIYGGGSVWTIPNAGVTNAP